LIEKPPAHKTTRAEDNLVFIFACTAALAFATWIIGAFDRWQHGEPILLMVFAPLTILSFISIGVGKKVIDRHDLTDDAIKRTTEAWENKLDHK